jgi:dynein heavy chain
MRGLKAILTAAGQLKRTMLNVKEDFVIMRALMDVNIPKFTTKDIPLFYGITGDLFPGIKLPEPDTEKLVDSIKLICEKLNLVSHENFISKCI